MILNDKQIIKLAEKHEMISPFVNKSVANGISHGVNPFGYDLRCGSEFKIFTNMKGAIADPKNFSEDNFITVKDEEIKELLKKKKVSNKYVTIFFGNLNNKNIKKLNISFVTKKKLGNAVKRNKIKRRLRNIMNDLEKKVPINFKFSYLVIAKATMLSNDYAYIKKTLIQEFSNIK